MTDNHVHTHCHAIMKDRWRKVTRYEHKWLEKERTPLEFVTALKSDLAGFFTVESYTERYRFDKDGHTAYYHLEFKFYDTDDRLTVHVFSCYCENFAEGDKPPF